MSQPGTSPRVAFLVAELGRSGGMGVVRRYARHLREREGWDVALVLTDRKARLPAEESGIPVRSLSSARTEPWDAVIATWWTTTEALWALDAARRVVFLQGPEHRFYRPEERADRLAALGVLDLPVDFLVVAHHLVELLAELRPEARVALVPNGIDKAIFRPRESSADRTDGPLRVLIEGQPSLWFKGVTEAAEATRAARHPVAVTLAVPDPSGVERAPVPGIDRVVGALDPTSMAALYAEHDVLLKLSRFEGLGLSPLEAFHLGTPLVATPYSGHEDYAHHGVNALLVGFDNAAGTARALDRLATDSALRRQLSKGALATAQRWPSTEESSSTWARALERLLAEDPPSGEPALQAMLQHRRMTTEAEREGQRRDGVVLAHTRGEVQWYAQAYEQAKATAAEHHAVSEQLGRELQALREERAYRLAVAMRKPLRRRRR